MDNIYHSCPAAMEDGGRQFTDHKSGTRRNEYIKYINEITRDDKYREFLQTNGTTIENNVWEYHKTHNSCRVNPCVHKYPTRMMPQQFLEERMAHDARAANDYKSKKANQNCPVFEDYRLTAKDDKKKE